MSESLSTKPSYYYSLVTLRQTDKVGEYVSVTSVRVPYFGDWTLCKGDPLAQQAEQSQVNFNNQLMQVFSQQYATQSNTLNYLKGKMQPIIDAGDTGYDPATLTAMRTSASDTNSQQFQNAQQALQNRISAGSGGSKLVGVSGAATQDISQLMAAGAETEAGSQNQITTNNANLKQQNYWNAINVLNGNAAQNNPLGYASSANQGGDAAANLSQANTASQQSGLLGALGGIVGGLGGAAIGKIPSCWVAASFYGWHDLRTFVIRIWMLHSAPAWFRSIYLKHGEWIASTPLRWAFLPIFEAVLAVA